MGNLTRLEDQGSRLARAVASSHAITFGCGAPYALGTVGFARIGFADIPTVGCIVNARSVDFQGGGVVAVVRQHIYRAVVDAGLETAALESVLHWGAESRQRMFRDANESSKSFGKNKRGAVIRCHLEIVEPALRKAFSDTLPTVYL